MAPASAALVRLLLHHTCSPLPCARATDTRMHARKGGHLHALMRRREVVVEGTCAVADSLASARKRNHERIHASMHAET
eukprot:6178909-Pleurochrysis_carterae.AAC.3